MEIEKKYLVKKLPENLETYPFNQLEQCYLCVNPVVRIRRRDDAYILTYKSRLVWIKTRIICVWLMSLRGH